MEFRQAKKEEIPEIAALYRAVTGTEFCTWNEQYPDIEEAENDFENRDLFVMTEDGEIVGALSVVPENELDDLPQWSCTGSACELARIAVRPARQGQGIALRMVREIESVLAGRGCRAVHLLAAKRNLPACRVYEKAGYRVMGECDRYGSHFLLCEKKLSETICGVDCSGCPMKERCGGCRKTCGSPFGGKCVLAECCRRRGFAVCADCTEDGCPTRRNLIDEINALPVPDMPEVTQLHALAGAYVNLAYPLPNGETVRLLDDRNVYLGTQLEREGKERCFGVVADDGFILVCEYGENGSDPELLLFRKRGR